MTDAASPGLIAVLLMSIAVCIPAICPLGATVLAAPPERRRWSATAIGVGAILGVAAGLVAVLLGPGSGLVGPGSVLADAGSGLPGRLQTGAAVCEIVGVLLAVVCAIMVLIRPAGSLLGIGAGVSGGLLLAAGMPLAPAISADGATGELAWTMLAVLVGPLAALLLAAAVVALGGMLRPIAIGVAVAALPSGALLLVSDVGRLLHQLSDAPLLELPTWMLVLVAPIVLIIAATIAALVMPPAPEPDDEDDARPLPEMPEDPFGP